MDTPVSARNSLLWLVAVGFFMETLDSTIVNTALASMARSLGESPLAMHSVVVAYSLTLAILIPMSGWLADRLGTRKSYFFAIALFTLGSLLCAASRTFSQLILSRIVQGMGGSMLMPVGRLAVLRAFPGAAYLPAISFISIPGLVGPMIGPTLGGWLVHIASWHWVFLINLPVGIIGALATWKWMPDTGGPRPQRFDFPGYVLLALSMLTFSLGLDGLSDSGYRQSTMFLMLVGGLACFASYWIHAAQAKAPLFSLRLFKTKTFAIGILGNMFARLGSGAMPLLIPLFLQVGLGYQAMQAGSMMLPMAVAALISKRATTPILLRFGYRRVLVWNTLFVGLAMASFAVTSRGEPVLLRILQIFFFGGVNSLQFTAMSTLTLQGLSPDESSSGNGLFSMVQLLSMSFGVAAGGALLNLFHRQLGTHDGALTAFHLTFVSVGLITCSSAVIFWHLPPELRARAQRMNVESVH